MCFPLPSSSGSDRWRRRQRRRRRPLQGSSSAAGSSNFRTPPPPPVGSDTSSILNHHRPQSGEKENQEKRANGGSRAGRATSWQAPHSQRRTISVAAQRNNRLEQRAPAATIANSVRWWAYERACVPSCVSECVRPHGSRTSERSATVQVSGNSSE